MPAVTATVFRTKMVGGGTSYDVYVERGQKVYYPISAGQYATVCCRDDRKYFDLVNFLRTPEIDTLPALSDERLEAFGRLRKVARRLEFKLACQAYPELRQLEKMPTLWCGWTLPSDSRLVTFQLRDKYLA